MMPRKCFVNLPIGRKEIVIDFQPFDGRGNTLAGVFSEKPVVKSNGKCLQPEALSECMNDVRTVLAAAEANQGIVGTAITKLLNSVIQELAKCRVIRKPLGLNLPMITIVAQAVRIDRDTKRT